MWIVVDFSRPRPLRTSDPEVTASGGVRYTLVVIVLGLLISPVE